MGGFLFRGFGGLFWKIKAPKSFVDYEQTDWWIGWWVDDVSGLMLDNTYKQHQHNIHYHYFIKNIYILHH